MLEPSGLHAVVTGDTVGSSDFPPDVRRHLPETLHSAYETIRQRDPASLPYDLAITGGDGWQWYIQNPHTALARVLHFWTLLFAREVSSRMILAVDTIDFLSEEDLNESDGPAFRRSGLQLSTLDEKARFECVLPKEASAAHHLAAESMSELVDHLLQQWTEAQAQAISGRISTVGAGDEITQQEIAENWSPEPITRQTVNRHLKRAHWDRLQRTLDRFETLVASLSS